MKTGIGGTPAAGEDWSLDSLGNWCRYVRKTSGTTNLDQSRVANKMNEITDVGESVGPSWLTPAYSRAGNMTIIPKPADPTVAFTATYDAWERLIEIEQGGAAVAEYAFDGANRRNVKKTYVGGELGETLHFFFSDPSRWQVLEERVGSSSDAQCHFVWGLRYLDDLILRDRDTNSDGSLNERFYGLKDANWNLTALADASSTVQERYAYDAYGNTTVAASSFESRPSSEFDWEVRFGGYCWDSESSFYHVRRRVLHYAYGKWLQRDPLSYFDSFNLYEYCNSSPVSNVDPAGTDVWPVTPPPTVPFATGQCKIAVRCNENMSGLGMHCGLNIVTSSGSWSLDGTGGDINQIDWVTPPYTSPMMAPYVAFPVSTCECLRKETVRWNALLVGRDHTSHNSNWTLRCLTEACNISIPWTKKLEAPMGWNCRECALWSDNSVPLTGADVCVPQCLKYVKCPCP